jgi:uncharacterized protein
MFVDIYEIEPEGVSFDVRPDLADAVRDDDLVLDVREARMRGAAVPDERGVELNARLTCVVRLGCSRCLEPFDRKVDTEFRLWLVPDATEFGAGEVQVTEKEASMFYTREGRADLGEIAAEQVQLALPLAPVCRADCRGLCPACGANRNEIECGCREETVDPRLAPLLEFKKRTDGA